MTKHSLKNIIYNKIIIPRIKLKIILTILMLLKKQRNNIKSNKCRDYVLNFK